MKKVLIVQHLRLHRRQHLSYMDFPLVLMYNCPYEKGIDIWNHWTGRLLVQRADPMDAKKPA